MPKEYFYLIGGSVLILNGIIIVAFFRARNITIPLRMKGVIVVQVATGILLLAVGIILKFYRVS